MRRCSVIVAVILAVSSVAACGGDSGNSRRAFVSDDATITVASFDFDESELLAEVYSQALEAQGFRVQRALRLGPREFVAPALEGGLIEFVPEYAGTALQFVSLGEHPQESDVDATHRALVRELNGRDVTALAAAPAQDANAFVVRRAIAERYGLQRLSDLTGVAPQLTLGGPPECPSRPLCLPGLQNVYGLQFEEFVPLDAGGQLTRDALRDGVVDIALLFTTDPAIDGPDFVALEDDLGLQPAENVTPLVRTDVVDQAGPTLSRAVDAVSQRLTTEALRDLNAQVTLVGSGVGEVASRWLEGEGLA